MSETDSSEDDFSLEPPSIIKQLKSILDQYGDGQILKELIQNADDAGAKTVKFMFDKSEYPTEHLYHPQLKQFQGCALYAFNDATFTSEDWNGIRLLQDSLKKNDPSRVGRFGLGFKSIFHLTDLPSIASGQKIGFIDPHAKYFKGQTGKLWNVTSRSKSWEKYKDQFIPFDKVYNHINLDGNPINGTLFRFPLRQCPSKLSEAVYTEDKLDSLFEDLKSEAHTYLLFLKHIECIEINTRDSDGGTPTTLYKVSIDENSLADAREARNKIVVSLKEATSCHTVKPYPITIIVETLDGLLDERKTERHSYIINEYLGDISRFGTEHGNIPLVGTAMVVSTNTSNWDEISDFENADGIQSGKIFCFLPLPLEQEHSSGLPVHVNGYFEVSHNRNHLEWLRKQNEPVWNQILLTECLPQCYLDLLLGAITLHRENPQICQPEDIYNAIPDTDLVDEKWKAINRVMNDFLQRGSLYTSPNGGQWTDIGNCYMYNEDVPDIVINLLIDIKVHAVKIPHHISKALNSGLGNMKRITPKFVRDKLRENQHLLHSKQPRERYTVLDYILSDNNTSDMHDIHNILPLADGSFTSITRKGYSESVYIQHAEFPLSLLPGLEYMFVENLDAEQGLKKKLADLAASRHTQLEGSTLNSFCKHVMTLLPEYMKGKETYEWRDEKHPEFPASWWLNLWSVLSNYYKQHQDTYCDIFKNVPLLPLKNHSPILLVRISKSFKLILDSFPGGSSITKVFLFLLEKNSIHVPRYQNLFDCIKLNESILASCFLSPTAENVLDVLHRRGLTNGLLEALRTDEGISFHKIIFDLFYRLPAIDEYKNILRELPVFKSLNKVLISINQASGGLAYGINLDLVNDVTDKVYIEVEKPECMLLSENFGLKMFDMWGILKHCISCTNSYTKVVPVFEKLFNDTRQLDTMHLAKYCDIPFVSTASGEYKSPKMLYMSSQILEDLFGKMSDKFPSGVYSSHAAKLILEGIGLKKEKDVSAKEILEQAKFLDKYTGDDVSTKMGDAILKLLISNEKLRNEVPAGHDSITEFYNDKRLIKPLLDLAWMPIVQEKPSNYPNTLSWTGTSKLEKPKKTKSKQWNYVIGSVCPIAKVDCVCDSAPVTGCACRVLDLSVPSLDECITHFKNVVESYDPSEKAKYLHCITSLYQFIFGHIRADSKTDAPHSDSSFIKTCFDMHGLQEWVWHGDGFCKPSEVLVVIRSDDMTQRKDQGEKMNFRDFRPYLYVLPKEVEHFTDFFIHCGAQTTLSQQLMIDMLNSVNQKHSSGFRSDKSRVDRDLDLVVGLLQDIESVESGDVLMPIDTHEECSLQLLPASKCTYLDNDWLGDASTDAMLESENKIFIIHPKARYVAEKHNVPSLMHRLVDDDGELPMSFGQGESLVDRIRGLLEKYSDGMSIPKEMIQNADDAGATKVDLLVDMRENNDAKKHLLDENMKLLQGPALWVHNDVSFTEEDFKNISKLVGRTKEKKVGAIGKFGLGFNTVYNVTDVPSIVSGDNLVMFDPQTKFLGKAIRDKSKPGIKINLKKNKVSLSKMQDQFKPYQGVFDCRIDPSNHVSYDGTLFRLPLRSHATLAFANELCGENGKAYTAQEIQVLLSMLSSNAHELLLFTQNVCEINVYYLAKDAQPNQLESILQVTRNVEMLISPKHMDCGRVTNVLANAAQCNAKKDSEQNTKDEYNSSYVLATHVSTHPKGIDFLCITVQLDSKYWLLSHACGAKMSPEIVGKVAVGGCGLQLKKTDNDNFRLLDSTDDDTNGKPFVFLPLPRETGLKFHINGCFAVDSSRKTIVTKDVDDKDTPMEHTWNISLLENSILESFVRLLFDLSAIMQEQQNKFYYIWPQINKTESEFKPFAIKFYREIVSRPEIPFTKENGKVVAMESLRILDNCFAKNCDLLSSALSFLQISHPQFHFTLSDNDVLDNFDTADLTHFRKEKTFTVRDFFKSSFIPNIDLVTDDDRDRLLLFAINDNFDAVKDLLAQETCIPVSPNGSKCLKPCYLISPSSTCAALFSINDKRFPHGSFRRPDILLKLEKIGMTVNDFKWSDLYKRAQKLSTVVSKGQHECLVRFQAILEAIEAHLRKDHKSDESQKVCRKWQKKFRKLKFVPLQQKSWLFDLSPTDNFSPYKLLPPNRVCAKSYMNLVFTELPVMIDVYLNTRTASFLGLNQENLDPALVVSHLRNLTELEVSNMADEKQVELQHVIFDVYDFLQRKIQQDITIVTNLQQSECIFLRSQFLYPSRVAITLTGNCAPYLYKVSDELIIRYRMLVLALGVKEHFDPNVFMSVLSGIKEKRGDRVLQDEEVDVIIDILKNLIAPIEKENIADKSIRKAMLVPNANGVLCEASGLCYSDILWAQTMRHKLAHPKISPQLAKQLGIKSSREAILKKCSYGIPCGQKQALCTNLKRILMNYPAESDIFLEFAQNADDAGASIIHFILDKNSYEGDKILDESLKELQGPALCVYNDKPFKEKDLEGIQWLGQGSKVNDPSTSGKYGIGFNTAYHITDVPCIMTTVEGKETNLLMLDPNCKYVPDTDQTNPGIRFENLTELKTLFPDMFKCFPLSTCDTRKGTLFRFPLRNTKMAEMSGIKHEETTCRDIEDAFKHFKEELTDMLVFTKNLDCIKLSVIEKHANEVCLQYSMQRSFFESHINEYQQFKKTTKEFAEAYIEDSSILTKVKCQQFSYHIKLEDELKRTRELHVVQQFGTEDTEKIPKSVVDAVERNKLPYLPLGGVACDVNLQPDSSSRLYSLMPIPVQNPLPVHINGDFVLGYENRRQLCSTEQEPYKKEWNAFLFSNVIAYCYIRLVDDFRETLRKCPGKEYKKHVSCYYGMFPNVDDSTPEWNIVTHSFYQHLLTTSARLFAKPMFTNSNTHIAWYSLNGDRTQTVYFASKKYIQNLDCDPGIKYGYSDITGSNSRVSSVSSSVQATNDTETKRVKPLSEYLNSCGYKVLIVPNFIMDNLKRFEVCKSELTPDTFINFLATHRDHGSLCTVSTEKNIAETPLVNPSVLNRVIRYCMGAEKALERLNKLPLLLTADKILRCFDKTNPVFDSTYSNLLQQNKHLFIDRSMSNIFNNDQCDYLKTFHMQDLTNYLHLEDYAMNIYNKKHVVEWIGRPDLPTKSTILGIWDFIKEDLTKRRNKTLTNSPIGKKEAETVKTMLSDWALLPVSAGTALFLVPFTLAHLIFDDTPKGDISSSSPIWLAITALPLYKLQFQYSAFDYYTMRAFDWVKHLCTNISQRRNVLKMVSHLVDHNTKVGDKLAEREDDCLIFFKYFNKAIEDGELGQNLEMNLRVLPIFENVNGKFTDIPEEFHPHTIPEGMPKEQVDEWEDPMRNRLVFLYHKDEFNPLYIYINCYVMNCIEVYTKFILPSFNLFHSSVQMQHIYFLYQQYFEEYLFQPNRTNLSRDARTIVEKLKCLEFIRDSKGQYRRAAAYFDPDVDLFKHLEDKSKFPPRCQSSYTRCKHKERTCGNIFIKERQQWISFLKLVGLKYVVTPDMLNRYASIICQPRLQEKGQAIVKHLFTEMEENDMMTVVKATYSDFSFSNIRFIEPYLVPRSLQAICLQKGIGGIGHVQCISFNTSLLEEHAELAWTREHILPRWADPGIYIKGKGSKEKVKDIRQLLGIQDSPKPHVVIDNLLTVCDQLNEAKQNIDLRTMDKIGLFKRYYSYFEQTKLTDIDLKRLKEAKCILVNEGKDLVVPQDIVHHLDGHEIMQPYLYKVPLDLLGSYTKFLDILGVSENPNATHFIMVLNKLHKEEGKLCLTVNKTQITTVAMAGLFACLDNGESIEDNGKLTLPLLSVHGDLCLSNKLVFNDAPSYLARIGGRRLKFMIYLSQTGLRTSQREERLIGKLPKHLRPLMLSDIVCETLIREPQHYSTRLDIWNERFQSDSFRSGITRLLRHSAHEMNDDISNETVEKILDRLSLVTVFETEPLETKLLYNGEEIPASITQKICFVHRQAAYFDVGDKFDIYIQANMADSYLHSDIIVQLASALNGVLEKRLSDSVLFLYSILQCPIDHISTKLDSFNVRVDTTQESRRSSILPALGSQLENKDLRNLNFECKDFHKGEYVAYRSGYSVVQVYAKVCEVLGSQVEIITEKNETPNKVHPILLSKIM